MQQVLSHCRLYWNISYICVELLVFITFAGDFLENFGRVFVQNQISFEPSFFFFLSFLKAAFQTIFFCLVSWGNDLKFVKF